MFCCGGDDSKTPKLGARDASVPGMDGNFELGKDHADYLQKSQQKTEAKNYEIKKLYDQQQAKGTDEQKATSRFWFEFQTKVTERLSDIRQIGKSEEEKEKAEKPEDAHNIFIKEVNYELEEPLLKIFAAYSKQEDTGDRKIGKEASLRFFDDLVNTSGEMALTSLQDYSRYCLKYYAQLDDTLQKERTDWAETAVTAAMKSARESALSSEASKAKKDNLSALKRAIANAQEAKVDTTSAEEKVANLAGQKERDDQKAEDKEKLAKEKAAKDREEKVGKMEPEAKEKFEKDESEKKKAEDKKAEEAAKAKATNQETMQKSLDDAKDDVEAYKKALDIAKKWAVKCDTTEADAKLAEMTETAADKQTKDDARNASDENWLLKLNNHIDELIRDWTTNYQANTFSQQKAAFEAIFSGDNKADNKDYELQRDYLVKVLAIGSGEGFEGFAQGMGFKVLESDCGEELKKMNEEKKDE